MAFDAKYLDPTGSGSKGAGACGIYAHPTDTLATMIADGYFDTMYSALAQTKELLLVATDGNLRMTVVRTAPTDVALASAVSAGTATAAAGAATLDKKRGKITSEALTTAGLASYTLTLTNPQVKAADVVTASLANGTNTQGTPTIGRVTPAAGSVVIVVYNLHSTQALNGTLVVSFDVATT